ncbi:ligand-binding sensor domain-containing protein [Pedobacter steynii]|uniref:histidine kinase n=1 Tax=Pedobacter steynii TaxID=430522 RepID=A0A1G9UM98_9SPHI|nr:two-component regulator propeller domain-containing protein [Pedobacter steynii]NQX40813.1 response regulator [Pedobacter steynii]SDM61072.1 ligand-binding sensor domain-containing protein [Pedobacter steynii]
MNNVFCSLFTRFFLLFSICIGLYGGAYGQEPSFVNLNVEHGLSQNSVLAITQDSRGFIWFGTGAGLNRYDGTRFKIYTSGADNPNGILDNYVKLLLADSFQQIWVGTAEGLTRLDVQTNSFFSIRNRSFAKGKVTLNTIYEDQQKRFWVGTKNGLFLLTDRKKNSFKRMYAGSIAGQDIRSIYQDSENCLWLGTDQGISKISNLGKNPVHRSFRQVMNDGAAVTHHITAICEDKNKTLWIGSSMGGLAFYDIKKQEFVKPAIPGLSGKTIRAITAGNNRLWVGTEDGLYIVDPVTKAASVYQHNPLDVKSLSQNSVYSIFRDLNGSMWVGTYYGGVNVVYPHNNVFYGSLSLPAGTVKNHNNVVRGITEDKEHNLFIATDGGGLNKNSGGSVQVFRNSPNEENSIGSNHVKTVYKDLDGDIWAGTHEGGLNLYARGSKGFKRFFYKNNGKNSNRDVLTLLQDTRRRFWIGTNYGLIVAKKNGQNLSPDPEINVSLLSNVIVRNIAEDAAKNIWFATDSGVFLLRNNAKYVEAIKELRQVYVMSIHPDNKGNLWLGTYQQGLIRYNVQNRSQKVFRICDGLPDNNVFSIQEDEHRNLWMGTSCGLLKINMDTHRIQTFDLKDGLKGAVFAANSVYKAGNGKMYFGSETGYTSFFPDQIKTNDYVAPLAITSLKLLGHTEGIHLKEKLLTNGNDETKKVQFSADEKAFTVEFSLLSYIRSGKNVYAYKLEGLDKNWIYTNNASITYTHLPTGNYTLYIKGANNDGVWSKPVGINLEILPPFWKTWWAYLFYVLMIAGLLFFVVRFLFLQTLVKKENALHQFKLNFFSNISHEIRTHLVLILGPLEKLNIYSKEDESVNRSLENMKRQADRLLALVNEQLDFRRVEMGNLKLEIGEHNIQTFLQDILVSFEHLYAAQNIRTSIVCNAQQLMLYFDKRQLEKVVFNLLSNAFKFTHRGGEVKIIIDETKTGLTINIEDNGKGISAGNLDKIFSNFYQEEDADLQNTGYGLGLALSKAIVELHKGTLSVESGWVNQENKTVFTVFLLFDKKHFGQYPLVENDFSTEILMKCTDEPEALCKASLQDDSSAGEMKVEEFQSILIIEDNAEVSAFIGESLKGNYKILQAANGIDGFNLAVEQIPDVIISDVMMPKMGGYELCKKLKTDIRTSHIPVILLTAKSEADHYRNGLEMGADIYLTKPFSIGILQLHIQNLLRLSQKIRDQFGPGVLTNLSEIPAIGKIDQQFLDKIIKIVNDNLEDFEFGVAELAAAVGMSIPVLYRKLKAVSNLSVNELIKSIKMDRAYDLLKRGDTRAYDIAYKLGYNDKKHFSKEFKKKFGQSPLELEKTLVNS